MAATVHIKRVTGPGGGQTLNDITAGTTRLNTADVVADGTANPTQVPAVGTNYSFWCSTRLVCSVAPVTGINNVRWFTDGVNSLGTGVGLNVSTVAGTNGSTTINYAQASGSAGVTGLEMGANYGGGITAPANAFSFTSASPLAVTGTFTTGVDTAANNATGSFADWVVLQITAGTTATSAITASETITYVWDEF